MPQETVWHEQDNSWVWKYKINGDTHDLYIDKGEAIRIIITKEKFVDMTADINKEQEGAAKVLPYMLYAQITDPGLGLLSWWS